MITDQNVIEHFKKQFTVNPTNGCWEWDKYLENNGYGRYYFLGSKPMKRDGAHRVSWQIHKEQDIGNLYVLHKCNNRKCVNPDHLFLGTHQDNMDDMLSKGTQASGIHNGSAFFSLEECNQMRDLYAQGFSSRKVARIFGASKTQVLRIVNNTTRLES